MSRPLEEATAWVYSGVWGVLTKWFRVPRTPPSLPAARAEDVQSFRPSAGFLRYLKLHFWCSMIILDAVILAAWIALTAALPIVGLALAPVAFLMMVIPNLISYVALHLRYDTTWYVTTERSLRIRRGIWEIHETTITFENVQNVSIESGPLERFFGIANVMVDTAGGGASSKEKGSSSNPHQGRIEGIDNADAIRGLILSRVRRSRSAGLGDDALHDIVWSSEHIAALREIRDALVSASHPGSLPSR